MYNIPSRAAFTMASSVCNREDEKNGEGEGERERKR